MKAIIITIGDEILLGQTLDSNSGYIARSLAHTGFEVVKILSIPDKREEIIKSLGFAIGHSDLVILTGGLGPTKDDVTKKVLADFFDSKLEERPEVLGWLKELLESRGIAMNANNRSQAILPDNCRTLRNYKGTASGMWFDSDGKSVISLPGVPFEMEHLMETYVIPELKAEYPDLALEYRMLKVYDVPESMLAQHLEVWEDGLPEGVGLAYLPSAGLVKLRVTAKGNAIKLLDDYYESLKTALSGYRFVEGEGAALEKQAGELLKEKGVTVATAESCTGGYIAHLFTSIAGSSGYFKGAVVAYSDEVKINVLGVKKEDIERYGVVSESVVKQMAEGVKRITGADYAISTSGIAGPGGGTEDKPVGTVWIGIATPHKTIAQKFTFSFIRERNIAKASIKGIELLIDQL